MHAAWAAWAGADAFGRAGTPAASIPSLRSQRHTPARPCHRSPMPMQWPRPKHKTSSRPRCRAKKKSPSQGRSQRPRRHSSSCETRRPRLLTTPIFPSTESQRRNSLSYWLILQLTSPGDPRKAKFSAWPLLKLFSTTTKRRPPLLKAT